MPHRPLRALFAFGAATLALPALASAEPAAEPATIKLEKFVVTPSRFDVSQQFVAGGASLTANDIEGLPQLGEDLYRTIARLPGLAADDFTAKFWVRGAPNSQVLARFDGVDLIEPFHMKDVDGALSIVDLPSISRLDLVTGGFTAEYGDRLAAVLTMETTGGNNLPRRTSLGLSLSSLRAASQGAFAEGRGHWLVNARRGYPNLALKLQGRDDEVDPVYYDFNAKLAYSPNPYHTFSLHVLHADDTLKVHKNGDPDLNSRYGSDYVWGRWQGRFGDHLSGEAVLAYTHLDWHRRGLGLYDQRFALDLRDDRELDLVSLRQDWSLTLTEKALVRAGFEVQSASASYRYDLERDQSVVSSGVQSTVRRSLHSALSPERDVGGAYTTLRLQPLAMLVVEPGLRFDRRDQTGSGEVSPRFNAALTLRRTTLRAAWGIYRQSQGVHELAIEDGDTKFHRSEQAEHRVLGIEQVLSAGLALRIEAYERRSTRLRPHWENLDNSYDIFPEAQSDRARFDPSEGNARGVEFLLQQRVGPRFNWNASYAFARAEETVAGLSVPRPRDQRHTFYADASYAPNSAWRFSAAWQFHTGWPVTAFNYNLVTLTNGRRVTVASPGPAYGERLPDYHRLDLRATRRWQLKRSEVRAYLDIFNAYDRVNSYGSINDVTVQGTNVTVTQRPRELLPFLPSIGAAWDF